MAGYQDFSKSNNAVEAEAQGLKPLRLMTLNDLRQAGWAESKAFAIWLAKEDFWQTSEVYGMRCLYDPTHLRELWEEAEENERKQWIASFAKAKKPLTAKVYENCTVWWLKWSRGALRKPECEECKEDGARVEVKGKTATVTLRDGQTFQKRLTTNGFHFHLNGTARKLALDELREALKRA